MVVVTIVELQNFLWALLLTLACTKTFLFISLYIAVHVFSDVQSS